MIKKDCYLTSKGVIVLNYVTAFRQAIVLLKGLGVLITLISASASVGPANAAIVFAVDSYRLSYKGTITVTTNKKSPSPLLSGQFPISTYIEQLVPASGTGRSMVAEHIAAVLPLSPTLRAIYDGNGNHLVNSFVSGASNGIYPRFLSGGIIRKGAGYFGPTQNIIILGQMNTWTTVTRPQFVALHLETSATPGQAITLSSIRSANLFAGDLLNNPPVPGGGTMRGMILRSGQTVDVVVNSGALPDAYHFGNMKGSAESDLSFTDGEGQIFRSHVKMVFTVLLERDTSPILDANGQPFGQSLPGP